MTFTIRKPDGSPIFNIHQTPSFFGWRIALHHFIDGDDPGFFHTHPAYAFRLVLWGGYVEEAVRDRSDWLGFCADQVLRKRYFFPGRFGIVTPKTEHRIDRLFGKRSISLWIRGPRIAPIRTRTIL